MDKDMNTRKLNIYSTEWLCQRYSRTWNSNCNLVRIKLTMDEMLRLQVLSSIHHLLREGSLRKRIEWKFCYNLVQLNDITCCQVPYILLWLDWRGESLRWSALLKFLKRHIGDSRLRSWKGWLCFCHLELSLTVGSDSLACLLNVILVQS